MHAAANVGDAETRNWIIQQQSPPGPTSCETLNYLRREGRDVQAPNLLVHQTLRAEKAKLCRVQLRTKPSKALQGPSGATGGCQAAPATCKPIFLWGKALAKSLQTRVAEGPSVSLELSLGGRLLHRQWPGQNGAGLGKAELPLLAAPEGPSSFCCFLGILESKAKAWESSTCLS